MEKSAVRLFPWTGIFACVVFVWMLFFNIRLIRDPDIWWHLASGRYIVTEHVIPKTDVFSFTARGSAWIDTYWLQETVMYWIHRTAGIPGLTIANAFVVALVIFLIGYKTSDTGLSLETRLLGIVWLFLAGHPRNFGWGEKASFVTLGFLAVLFYSLRSHRFQFRWNIQWALLFALWANLHRGFILGLAILGIHVLIESVQHPKNSLRLLSSWTACALATLTNPYGYRVYGMGWQDIHVSPINVTGWAQTPFGHLELFWITLFIFWVITVWRIWKKDPPVLAFLAISAFLSALSMRYASLYPYFLIWAIPWLLPAISKITFLKSRDILALTAVLMGTFSIHLHPAFGANPRVFPVEAAEFLQSHHWTEPFYHEYEFGGYWMWTLQGQPPVMIDGRYPAVQGYQRLFENMQKATQGSPEDFHRFLHALGVHCAVVKYPSTKFLPSPFSTYFPRQQWALIYWDDLTLIFAERRPEFKGFLSREEFRYIQPDADPTYWMKTIWAHAHSRERVLIHDEFRRNAWLHPTSRRVQFWIALTRPSETAQ